MTSKPAEVFGFVDRGVLKVGNFADIVIFNPESVIDKGTFVEPIQYPEGIQYVMVNGLLVVENGAPTKILAGRVIRKTKQ